jgi:hypothetical protein
MKVDKNVFWAVIIPVIIAIGMVLHFYTDVGTGTGTDVTKKSSGSKKKSTAEVLDEIYVKFIDVMNALKPYTEMEISEKSLEKTIEADKAQKHLSAEGFENMDAENILLQLNKAYEREYAVMNRINDLEMQVSHKLAMEYDCSGNESICVTWFQTIDIDELYNIEVNANIYEAEELKALRTEHVALLDEIYELEVKSREIYNESSDVKHITYHDVLKDQVTEMEQEAKQVAMTAEDAKVVAAVDAAWEQMPPPFDMSELDEMESLEDIDRIRGIIREYINYYELLLSSFELTEDQKAEFTATVEAFKELLYSLDYLYVETTVYTWLLETHKRPILIDLGLALFYTPKFDDVVINHVSIDEITSIIDPLIGTFVSEPYDVFMEKVDNTLLE